MTWQREWQAIAESISDFSDICKGQVAALHAKSSDDLGTMSNIIVPMAEDIVTRVCILRDRYKLQLPGKALERIENFTKNVMFTAGGLSSSLKKSPTSVSHFSVICQRLRSDVNYFTSDLEGTMLRLTERAFLHLQRSIVADPDIRDRWGRAFSIGEVACEKLGSTHLLLHGIWSFKVHGEGERTDLVLGEPITNTNMSDVELSAEGLVLTEWKVATQQDMSQKHVQALTRAQLYGRGVLAAIELKSYRYLVLVSEDVLKDIPSDHEEGGIIYRTVNIAVNPSSPSKVARRRT